MTLRRMLQGSTVALGAFVIISLVVYFPSLAEKSLPQDSDWAALSDIGQAYGGISAILSAIALSGISLSLLLQYRQHRAEVLYSLNQRQFDLVRYALDNPHVRPKVGRRRKQG